MKHVNDMSISAEDAKPPDERTIEEVIEQGALPDEERTRPGSFEAFTRAAAEG